MKWPIVRSIAIGLLVLAVPAQAQFAVIDPANLIQNVLTAARTLTQIENQIRQLQNEAEMLINEARNLEHLDFNSWQRLRETLEATRALIDQAKGIAYEVSLVREQFETLYPEQYDAAISAAEMWDQVQQRWNRSRDALATALAVQAQAVENIPSDEGVLSDLVARSQSAVGALQAAQATNQLLALQVRQAIQAQQLQLVQDRAIALEQARAVAANTRAREVRRRFQGEGVRYTPQAVEY